MDNIKIPFRMMREIIIRRGIHRLSASSRSFSSGLASGAGAFLSTSWHRESHGAAIQIDRGDRGRGAHRIPCPYPFPHGQGQEIGFVTALIAEFAVRESFARRRGHTAPHFRLVSQLTTKLKRTENFSR